MPSVFERIGALAQPDFTPIPQMGHDLQSESLAYFNIPKNAQAADNDELGIKVLQPFALDTHRDFLTRCTAEFKQNLQNLKSRDQKIMLAVVTGILAAAFAFVPIIGLLGMIAWGIAAYQMYQRATESTKYSESLTLLVAVCNWSLGPKPSDTAKTSELVQDKDIRAMMTALYPVLTNTQVKHLLADEIEAEFLFELQKYEESFNHGFNEEFFDGETRDEQLALSKKEAECMRCVYGFNKGNAVDYFDAFISIFPDLWNGLAHNVQRLVRYCRGPAAAATPEAGATGAGSATSSEGVTASNVKLPPVADTAARTASAEQPSSPSSAAASKPASSFSFKDATGLALLQTSKPAVTADASVAPSASAP